MNDSGKLYFWNFIRGFGVDGGGSFYLVIASGRTSSAIVYDTILGDMRYYTYGYDLVVYLEGLVGNGTANITEVG
jgi:hypothetical protein